MYGFYDSYARPEPVIIAHLKAALGSNFSVGTTHKQISGKHSIVVRSNGYNSENRVRNYSVSCILYMDSSSTSYQESVEVAELIEKQLMIVSQNGQNAFKGITGFNTLDFTGPTGQIGQNITFSLLVGAKRTEKLGE